MSDFIKVDSDKIYDDIISELSNHCNEPLYPGDERRIFGEGLVSLFVALISTFNDKAKQRFLRYARKEALDGAGELLGVIRAEATRSYATFRFSLSVSRPDAVVIPLGTRITTDGSVYFETADVATINAGETYVDVKAYCQQTGEQHNGYAIGTVNTLVDLIPYVDKVENITESVGGDDGEPYTDEGDDRFRERIRLAPAQLTTAGPETGYIYHAMSASGNIADVAVDSPSECVVNIYPLLKGGVLPDSDVLTAVAQACNAKDVRPMTDQVHVLAPTQVEYSINIHYYCSAADEVDVVEAVEGAGGAVEQYNEWQQSGLGMAINPDALRKMMLVPGGIKVGVDRVDITAPTYQKLEKNEVAKLTGKITVTHEVI